MPVLVYCRMTLEKKRVGLYLSNKIHRHTFVKLRIQSSSESEDGIYLSLTIDSCGGPGKANCCKGLDSKGGVLFSQFGTSGRFKNSSPGSYVIGNYHFRGIFNLKRSCFNRRGGDSCTGSQRCTSCFNGQAHAVRETCVAQRVDESRSNQVIGISKCNNTSYVVSSIYTASKLHI